MSKENEIFEHEIELDEEVSRFIDEQVKLSKELGYDFDSEDIIRLAILHYFDEKMNWTTEEFKIHLEKLLAFNKKLKEIDKKKKLKRE